MTQLSFDPPLTVEEAAQALSVNRATVYELLKSGELRSIKIRAATRILSTEIERYFSSLPNGSYAPLGRKQGAHA